MILKEFRQMRRDRRTVALMVGMPVMMLIIFGYAARFDVTSIPTAVVGPNAAAVGGLLDDAFEVVVSDPVGDAEMARELLRDSEAAIAIVANSTPTVFVDGTELFVAQSAMRRVTSLPAGAQVEVLFNPELSTSAVMVPSLIGLIARTSRPLNFTLAAKPEGESAFCCGTAGLELRPPPSATS